MSSTNASALVVLVVEDHEDTRDLYIEALTRAGYLAHGAGSVAEAREVLTRGHADMLVADYSLPDGTGGELTRMCSDAKPRVCILISGHAANAVDATGFHVTLMKPIHAGALVNAIRSLLSPTEEDMQAADDETGRYMVLTETGSVTSAAALNVSRAEAWRITRELRATGQHVYIMRTDIECATCVVKGDEPLPEE